MRILLLAVAELLPDGVQAHDKVFDLHYTLLRIDLADGVQQFGQEQHMWGMVLRTDNLLEVVLEATNTGECLYQRVDETSVPIVIDSSEFVAG